jgi:hypothetical protein
MTILFKVNGMGILEMVSQAFREALGLASLLMLAAMKYRKFSSSFLVVELAVVRGT